MNYLNEIISSITQDLAKTLIYLPAGFTVLAVATILTKIWKTLSCGIYRGHSRDKTRHVLASNLLVAYLFVILCITFLSRESGSRSGLDLVPLATMGHGPQNDAYVVENILLFIPLGVLTPAACRWMRRLRRCAVSGLALSLCIEISQMITKRGYVQTDDVLMNVSGMIAGYWIWRILQGAGKDLQQ